MVVVGQGGVEDVMEAVGEGGDVVACPLPLLLTREGHALVGPVEMEAMGTQGSARKRARRGRGRERGREEEEEGEGEGEAGMEEEEGEGEGEAGMINLWDRGWRKEARPLRRGCACLACRSLHSRGYLHHLLLCHEMLGEVLLFAHNLEWVLALSEGMRKAVLAGQWAEYRAWIGAGFGKVGESGGKVGAKRGRGVGGGGEAARGQG
jgi:queuine/archaeosine tRNA-ribosyltransferase